MSDLWDFMSDFVQNFLKLCGIMASMKGTRPAFPENDEEDYVMLKKIAALVLSIALCLSLVSFAVADIPTPTTAMSHPLTTSRLRQELPRLVTSFQAFGHCVEARATKSCLAHPSLNSSRLKPK